MDLNLIRSVVTLVSLLCFLAIVVWAYSRTRRFDTAAALPFSGDELERGASNE